MTDPATGPVTGDDGPGTVVDARGALCPLPVILLARAARGLPAGSRVTVLATDPAARHDVPAWARMRGHRVVSLETGDEAAPLGTLRIVVAIGSPAP